MNYIDSIQSIGFIPATTISSTKKKLGKKENSIEDYVGKITSIFLPYILPQSISERSNLQLQENLKRIVSEIKGKES